MERATSEVALFEFGEFRLDAARAALLRDGAEVHLRPKSFQVLEYLVRHPGRLVPRRELMDAVWGRAIVTDDSLTQCLIDIRRALGDTDQQAVRTIPRRGFVFEWPVTVATGDAPAAGPVEVTAQPAPAATTPAAPPLPAHDASPRTWTVPVIIGLAALLGIVAWWILGRPAEPVGTAPAGAPVIAPANSIAVLRFADMSPAGDKQYFADGLAEEVLHRLAQSADLVVIARSSSFAVEPAAADVRQVAAELGVAHVLEGSVRRDGDDLRVTAQLIDAQSGAHVWSKQFAGRATDLIGLQDRIAAEVAESLHATLTAQVPGAAAGIDPAAQELFLQGLSFYNRRAPGDVALARDYFERAVAIQPDHARALTALAGVLRLQAFAGDVDWDESVAAQQAVLTRALAADPGLAEAHVRLASVQYVLGNEELAWETFERGAALDPNSTLVLGMRAGLALRAGRIDEAIELSRQVVRRDPLSAVAHANVAHELFAAGRLEEAEAAWLRAADLGQDDRFQTEIARVRILQARFGDAVELVKGLENGPQRDQVLAMAAPVAGTPEEASAAAARLADAGTRISQVMLAEVLAFQGHVDEAFAALERAVAGLSGDPLRPDYRKEPGDDWAQAAQIINLSPFLAQLRSDPRWADYEGVDW